MLKKFNLKMLRGWMQLHNTELHGLYALADIKKVIEENGFRWVSEISFIGNIRTVMLYCYISASYCTV
jgi:hypothetical protein